MLHNDVNMVYVFCFTIYSCFVLQVLAVLAKCNCFINFELYYGDGEHRAAL